MARAEVVAAEGRIREGGEEQSNILRISNAKCENGRLDSHVLFRLSLSFALVPGNYTILSFDASS